MPIKHSVHDVEFKALDTSEKGEFEAIVSVFNNVDYGGDRVLPGSFTKSIAELREKGDPLPLIWSHDWGDPNAHIGKALPENIEETDRGLKIKGQLDLDNPFAAQVFRLLKERRVREFSFGYEIRDERRAKDGANELVELGLIEAGPTLKGMNPSTELLSVKADLEAAASDPDEETPEADCGCGKSSDSLVSALGEIVADLVAEKIKQFFPTDLPVTEAGVEEKSVEPDDAPAGKSEDDDDLLRMRLAIEAAR